VSSTVAVPSRTWLGQLNRVPAVAVGVGLAAMPFIKPEGPGNTAPADIVMAGAIAIVLLWVGGRGLRFHLPYAVPMGIMIITGLLATMFSVVPAAGILAVSQDAFVLLWAAAIANVMREPKYASAVLASWVWTAVTLATFLAAAVATHQWALVGVSNPAGGRAQLTFDNPNMAGNYFVISFFVMLLSRYPQHRLARIYACVILLVATMLSGSLAALLSLAGGVVAVGFFAMWRRADVVAAFAVTAVAGILLVGFAYHAIDTGLFQRVEGSTNTLVERSVGRSTKSAEGRQTLFMQEFQLYRTGSLLGRGPASTKDTFDPLSSEIVKEAHDDYLATLLERGPLGVIGLIILVASIAVRASAVAMRRLKPEFARLVTSPAMIVGAVMTMAATATTHEILHYRHVWAFLGILGGLYLFARQEPDPAPADLRGDA
jgi:O-antigen ligase